MSDETVTSEPTAAAELPTPATGLTIDGVSVRFEQTQAVDDVSLHLDAGQVLAVLGPSGCGKSTLLRVVAGLQRPDSGRVLFDGQDITGVPTHQRGFALMFQDGQLFAHKTVGANVAYALKRQGVSRRDADARVAELLELVGLPGTESRRPATLSGGQQQRVALARALAARPRMLLLDEPLSSLDRSLRDRLGSDLRQILTESGTTALLVTHDHDEAFTLADQMAVMRAGQIVQHGPTDAVWRHPADAETAEFLGYTTILDGEAAELVMRRAGGLDTGLRKLRPYSTSVGEGLPASEGGLDTGLRKLRPYSTSVGEGLPGSAGGLDTPSASAPGYSTGAQGSSTGEGVGRRVALRRQAFRIDAEGDWSATVTAAAQAADVIRLQVDIDGIGAAQAIGGLQVQGGLPTAGSRVQLSLDPAAVAVLPEA